jgi:hypothetical protein
MVMAGKLRLLAVFTAQRAKRFPEAPTVRELGMDIVVDGPGGVIGPRGMHLRGGARAAAPAEPAAGVIYCPLSPNEIIWSLRKTTSVAPNDELPGPLHIARVMPLAALLLSTVASQPMTCAT